MTRSIRLAGALLMLAAACTAVAESERSTYSDGEVVKAANEFFATGSREFGEERWLLRCASASAGARD